MPIDWRRIEVLDEAQAEIFRGMTPAERLAVANDCNLSARRLIAAHLRSIQPDWTEDQISFEVARRMLSGSN